MQCTYCKETIQDGAQLCRFCGRATPEARARGQKQWGVVLSIVLIAVALIGLGFKLFNSVASRGSPSQNDELVSGSPPVDVKRIAEERACQEAQAQWTSQANEWDNQNAQRQQTCASLDAQQVDLNTAYQQLKHESPATTEVVIASMRQASARPLNDEDKGAILIECAMVAPGGGDCGKTFNDIRAVKEKQRLLNNQDEQACCSVNTSEDVYSDLGLSFSPACKMPPRPERPTCSIG